MPNGPEQTVWASIDDIREDIKILVRSGCAKREGDLLRVDQIKRDVDAHGAKLDRIYYTSLVTAGGVIMFLLKAFIPMLFGK